jgi:hypothetical protein
MSRNTIYQDSRLTLVNGQDHMVGDFIQLYDNELKDETLEGEGLILDWSDDLGMEINLTGISNNFGTPEEICNEYIKTTKNTNN